MFLCLTVLYITAENERQTRLAKKKKKTKKKEDTYTTEPKLYKTQTLLPFDLQMVQPSREMANFELFKGGLLSMQ